MVALQGVTADTVDRTLRLEMVSGDIGALADDDILVDESVAKDKGWKVGDPIPILFGQTGKQELTLGGTYAENQIAGSYLIGLDTYEQNFSQQLDQVVAMTVTPDADVDQVRGRHPGRRRRLQPGDPGPERVQGGAAQSRSTSCSASSSCCSRWRC